MPRALSRTSSVQVWPAFTDAMLAFVLVLVLLLVYQVGQQIEIAGPDQAQILRDQTRVQALVDSLNIPDVEVASGTGRQEITFGSEVLFASGSPDLKPEGRALIGRLASAVASEGLSTLEEIQVNGHTDTVQTGQQPSYTNWELSADRATNVVRSLQDAGIDPQKVQLSATGYGEHDPVSDNETPQGRAANRRIQVRLLYAQRDDADSQPL